MRRLSFALFASLIALLVACATSNTTKIHQPIAVDLGHYETCTIEMAEPLTDGPRATSAFVAYLEGRLREEAVLEPVAPDRTSDAEIVIRLRPSAASAPKRVTLVVELVLAKDKTEKIGAFEVSGEQDELGGSLASSPRGIALQRAADAIATTMKASRRAETRVASRARASASATPPAPAKPVDPADDPFAVRSPNAPRPRICLSTCDPPASSAFTQDELSKITIRIDPTLQTLRACLRRVGAELVEPAVLLRFGAGGELVGMRVDLGGYEDQLSCVSDVWAEPPRIRTSRAAMVRCVFHCASPPPEEP